MTIFLCSCLAVGALAGFLAGLFGIGGGLIIVPSLLFLMPTVGIEPASLMSFALGTSFATIVVTALSSAQRHHKYGNVDWQAAKVLAPALMVSVFLSGLVVSHLPASLTQKIFAVLVVYLALKMLLSSMQHHSQPPRHARPMRTGKTLLAGGVIGAIASMAGIAGGVFVIPFLTGRGIDLKRAIGTSSFCGALLGLSGASSYVVAGLKIGNLPDYSLGYIYLPAFVGITMASAFTSKLGADAARVLPAQALKKAFAVLMMCIAVSIWLK